MTYTEYNSNTIFNKRGKPPVVRIECGKNARINFSVEAVKLLGLKEGMKLAFRTYKDDKLTAYFYEQATGIKLVAEKNNLKETRLAIYCRPLAQKLLEHFGFKGDCKKTFVLNTVRVPIPETKCNAWIIDKEKIHTPIQWRKKL